MAYLSEIESRRRGLSFVLEVDGAEHRWYAGPEPTADSPYTYVPGIIGVSPIEESIELIGGIGRSGSCTVTIANTLSNSAAERLCKVSWRGSSWNAVLDATLAQETGTTTVTIDGDNSGLASTGVLWVGQEAIKYTTKPSSTTFGGLTRGYYGSPIQQHVVNAGEGWTPRVTADLVSWHTRPARILVGNARPDGSLSGNFVEFVNGFVDSSPVLLADGLTVEVTVVPWIAALDNTVGGKMRQTQLLHGWHYFTTDAAYQINGRMGFAQAAGFWGQTTDIDLANSQELHCPGSGDTTSGGRHKDAFDKSLASTHPRAGVVILPGNTPEELLPTDYNDGPTPYFDLVASQPSNDTSAGILVLNREGYERFSYDIIQASRTTASDPGDTALKRWPGEVLDEFNTAFATSTNKGATGIWANLRIEMLARYDEDDLGNDLHGPIVSARLNQALTPPGLLTIRWAPMVSTGGLYYGVDFHQAGDSAIYRPDLVSTSRSTELNQWSASNMGVKRTSAAGQGRDKFPIRGIANAFYQWGEEVVLVEDNPFDVTGDLSNPAWIKVDFEAEHEGIYDERGDEGRVTAYFRVDNVTQQLDGATPIGYRWQVDRRDQFRLICFGDWGSKRARLISVIRWQDWRADAIMLELLYSGQGNGFNSAVFDIQPYGLNLDDDIVDSASFFRFPLTQQFARWTLVVEESRSASDIVGGMLAALNAGIVQRVNPETGDRKLAMVPIGVANAFESTMIILDGDWLVNGRPSSTTDRKVKNRYHFNLNWDETSRKHRLSVQYNDRDSIQEHGEAGVDKIDLRGLDLPLDEPAAQNLTLRPIFDERRALYGQPRRMLSGSLCWSDAARLYAGAVVTVSASEAIDFDGSKGISDRIARVVKVQHDPWNQMADVTMVLHGFNTVAWAPALKVKTVVSTTIFEVETNEFTESVDPVTGGVQTDLKYVDGDTDVEYFSAGDSITFVPRGDYASRATRVIDSVDHTTKRVTITVALAGVSVGDTIRVASYDDASAYQKSFAYLANASRTIGTAAATAKDYG